MKHKIPETPHCDGCAHFDEREDGCALSSFEGQYKPWCCEYKTPEPHKKWSSSDVSRPLSSVFNMTYLLREH